MHPILYTEIDHTPLLLALTLDYSSLREDYTRIAFLLVIVSALCILCVLLFTFYFSNSMLLPIEELSEQMLHQSDPVVHSKRIIPVGKMKSEPFIVSTT